MTKELEALLLIAAKALDLGVVGVSKERAQEFGVPVGVFVSAGSVLPGHSKKAKTSGYYCPYSVWRPPSGQCLLVHGELGSYRLAVLREDSGAHYSFNGRLDGMDLREMKAYLRGVADAAESMPKPRRRR